MEKRTLGKTGLSVTPIGFGTAQLGYLNVPQNESTAILNSVLDAGINLIDTADCYPGAETRIGEAISHRRAEYLLVSKCGHQTDPGDPPSWSAPLIRLNAERSLKRMKADHLDLLLLHSCGEAELKNNAMLEALRKCKQDGLTRFIGYSGDNQPAERATGIDFFDCLETSVSIADQQSLDRWVPRADSKNFGIIAKRPIANAAWRDLAQYSPMYVAYAEPYTKRLRKMGFTPESLGFDGDWAELALRFTAFQPGVDCMIIGGKVIDHVRENIAALSRGPLPSGVVKKIREIWKKHDDGSWTGQI